MPWSAVKCFSMALVSALITAALAPISVSADLSRARDLGIPFDGHPGTWNAITDVPHLEVGYSTLITGEGPHAVRTGVTVVFPRGKNADDPVFAGWDALNGVGEMTGTGFIDEEGLLEGPIATTNSVSIGTVRDAISEWMLKKWPNICCLPVVAETHDGYLNDIAGFHVHKADVYHAIDKAASGPLLEGNVGGGTGMTVFGFKGGMGTASRIVEGAFGRYTLGVLVQANFGLRRQLRIAGVQVGKELAALDKTHAMLDPQLDREQGSIIIIIATDAPLLPHQLKRIAKRAGDGLARTGAINDDLSGDIAVAFSTANPGLIGVSSATRESLQHATVAHIEMLPSAQIDPFFEATVQATEEAVINALMAAQTMTGVNGHRAEAIDHAKVRELLRNHGMLVEPAVPIEKGS